MPTIIFEGEVEMPDFNGDKMRKGLGEYFECLDPENRLTKFKAGLKYKYHIPGEVLARDVDWEREEE